MATFRQLYIVLLLSGFWSITYAQNPEILPIAVGRINNNPFYTEDFVKRLQSERHKIYPYFKEIPSIDLGRGKSWDMPIGSTTPIQFLVNSVIETTTQEWARAKVLKAYGIDVELDYLALKVACENYNRSRRAAKQRGDIVYGRLELSVAAYRQHILSEGYYNALSLIMKDHSNLDYTHAYDTLEGKYFKEGTDFAEVKGIISKRVAESLFNQFENQVLSEITVDIDKQAVNEVVSKQDMWKGIQVFKLN